MNRLILSLHWMMKNISYFNVYVVMRMRRVSCVGFGLCVYDVSILALQLTMLIASIFFLFCCKCKIDELYQYVQELSNNYCG